MTEPFTSHVSCGFFPPVAASLASELISLGQDHLFSDWDPPGTNDQAKRDFLDTLLLANSSYPGGLATYISNAKVLLGKAAADHNAFEGCSPGQPDLVDLSGFGSAYDAAEAAGLAAFGDAAVVLVAGGLGERLGYSGIKLDIPVEVTLNTSYLAHYASYIAEISRRHGKPVPLIIMTSRETDDGTRASLEKNHFFGLQPHQVTVLRQELVPAIADIQGHLALEEKYRMVMKPHGHGDIHMLLHSSGTARKLAETGIRHLLFIQDTNGQAFNAAFAAIGVSETHGYDFNSIAVNRIPGEAVGAITRLTKPGHPPLTLNVEYNLLDPLLRATVNPEGDVPNEQGFSAFPGNINLLVIRMAPYLHVLEDSRGIIAEFVNPKFSDASRTSFKKPTRLETMMQDLPKLFSSGEKVGVTVFDRRWCFSPCKNNLSDAAAKVAQGGPPESASSAENDFYAAGRLRVSQAGMTVNESPEIAVSGIPITPGPRVILRPSFALTLSEVRERIHGGSISGTATLMVEGDCHLHNVTVPDNTTLMLTAEAGKPLTVEDLTATDSGFRLEELQDASAPEYLRIRGYRITED